MSLLVNELTSGLQVHSDRSVGERDAGLFIVVSCNMWGIFWTVHWGKHLYTEKLPMIPNHHYIFPSFPSFLPCVSLHLSCSSRWTYGHDFWYVDVSPCFPNSILTTERAWYYQCPNPTIIVRQHDQGASIIYISVSKSTHWQWPAPMGSWRVYYCFAKAVHSLAKLRTANSLFVRLFILSSVSCPTWVHPYISVWHVRTQWEMYTVQVKRYSCAFPLRNKLFAEDRSFS